MGLENKRIAVLCDYKLMPERVGGMDYFFWNFDAKCKENNIMVDWFFPNSTAHGQYEKLRIFSEEKNSVEQTFLTYCSMEKPGYTHIITHFLELCTPFFKELKKNSAVEIIAVDHNPRPLKGYPIKKRLLKRIKGALFSRYIDTFVGVSNYTVKQLIKDFGNQIRAKTITVYNGIQVAEIETHKGVSDKYPKFLVASHLRESKGIQDLVEAVAILPSNLKEGLKIDVFGEGPYKKQLTETIAKHQLENVFIFHGSTDSLKEILCKYDYLLHPTHMECFSLTLLESLAANVPVVTTPVGGNPEVIREGENGFLFDARNVEQLSSILKDLIAGHKRIIDDSLRAEIMERFTIDVMIANHYKLLK